MQEVNCKAADKVKVWEQFRHHMNMVLVANEVPPERQYALILVTAGDEAFDRWNTPRLGMGSI